MSLTGKGIGKVRVAHDRADDAARRWRMWIGEEHGFLLFGPDAAAPDLSKGEVVELVGRERMQVGQRRWFVRREGRARCSRGEVETICSLLWV